MSYSYHIFVIFLPYFSHILVIILSYSCYCAVIYLSYSGHIVVIYLSYSCHILAILFSCSCHNLLIFLSYFCKILDMFFPEFCLGTFLSHCRHTFVTFLSYSWILLSLSDTVIFCVCWTGCWRFHLWTLLLLKQQVFAASGSNQGNDKSFQYGMPSTGTTPFCTFFQSSRVDHQELGWRVAYAAQLWRGLEFCSTEPNSCWLSGFW